MPENRTRLMRAMGQLNQRYGRRTLTLTSGWGAEGNEVVSDAPETVVVGVHDGLAGVGGGGSLIEKSMLDKSIQLRVRKQC
jgi:hypothetical protein